MSLKYVKVKPLKNTPPFRKIALGTWRSPNDPHIYGTIELDMTNANAWLKSKNLESSHITVLHMVARAYGLAMEKYPDLNGFVRFKKIYLRQSVDIFFHVMTNDKTRRNDLTGIKIYDVNKKSVQQIAEEMGEKVNRVRNMKDTQIQKTMRFFKIFPAWLVKILLGITSFISYTLNLKFPGIPKDQFGGCMISNVGALGLDLAYAPLVPYSRVPVVLLLGQVKKRPVVIDDKIEIREIALLNASIDHRFCDGALLAKMVWFIKRCFEKPERFFEIKPETEAIAKKITKQFFKNQNSADNFEN